MKLARVLAPVVLAVALGAATTLALAWGLAGWRAPNARVHGELVGAEELPPAIAGKVRPSKAIGWLFSDSRRFGERSVSLFTTLYGNVPQKITHSRPAISAEIDAFLEHRWAADPQEPLRRIHCSFKVWMFGWPLPCLWYGKLSNFGRPAEGPWYKEGYGALTWGSAIGMQYPLPTRVLWGGLIVGSVVWGVVWWGLLLVPGLVRRVVRRRRGLCEKCGYDLRATPAGSPCPECGSENAGRAGTLGA